MDRLQLKEIIHQHSLWLKDPKSGKRADLCGADPHRTVLRRADLSGAKLGGADLSGADLREVKFTVELRDVNSMEGIKYNSEQFPWLSLNRDFLGSVKSNTSL